MKTDQLNIRLEPKLIQRMEKAAARYGIRSRNAVAQEIVEQYFDLWEQLQEAKLELFLKQREALLGQELAHVRKAK